MPLNFEEEREGLIHFRVGSLTVNTLCHKVYPGVMSRHALFAADEVYAKGEVRRNETGETCLR